MKTKLLLLLLSTCIYMTTYNGQIYDDLSSKAAVNDQQGNPTDGRISLKLAGNGSYATILVGFIPEGTVNFDEGYDGYFINDGAVIEFYSFLNTTRLSIQALPELSNVDVQVPLGYEITSDGTYTISIDAEFLDPNFDIILEDVYEGVFTDLRMSNYSFSGITGETHDRFFLNLDYRNTLNISGAEDGSNNIHAYFSSNKLKTHTLRTDIKTIELFNDSGKRVLYSDFEQEIPLKEISSSVYIIRYNTISNDKIIKKIIK